MLAEDLTAPRKQKHTARRVFARLVDEHGATEVSYSTVRNDVPWPAAWRLMLTLDGGRRCSLRRNTALRRFGLEATVRPPLALYNTAARSTRWSPSCTASPTPDRAAPPSLPVRPCLPRAPRPTGRC